MWAKTTLGVRHDDDNDPGGVRGRPDLDRIGHPTPAMTRVAGWQGDPATLVPLLTNVHKSSRLCAIREWVRRSRPQTTPAGVTSPPWAPALQRGVNLLPSSSPRKPGLHAGLSCVHHHRSPLPSGALPLPGAVVDRAGQSRLNHTRSAPDDPSGDEADASAARRTLALPGSTEPSAGVACRGASAPWPRRSRPALARPPSRPRVSRLR